MIQKICKCCGPIGQYERRPSDPQNCKVLVVPYCRHCSANAVQKVPLQIELTEELLAAYSRMAAE